MKTSVKLNRGRLWLSMTVSGRGDLTVSDCSLLSCKEQATEHSGPCLKSL